MAQGSLPWDDGAGGDATAGSAEFDSPYSSAEWRKFWSIMFGSNRAEGMVMPYLDNMLHVYESAVPAMTVEVDTGWMFSRGALYANNAVETLAIAASDPVNPRIDRVVATLTVATQEIRLEVVTGIAAAAPAVPALTTNAAIWQVDIAHVYVQGNALAITDEDISDKRVFFNNGLQAPNLMGYNLITNSEFMAYSILSSADPSTSPPDYWRLVGTPSAMTRDTRADQMSRGGSLKITTDAANEGVYQSIQVKPDTPYTIKLAVYVTAADTGKVVVTTDSGAPDTITREIRRSAEWLTETIYYETEADAEWMTIQLLGLSAGDIVWYGQVLISEGYDAGPFREIHETLPFEWYSIRDASWNGDAKAINTNYDIDFSASFGGYIMPGVRAVMLFMHEASNSNGTWEVRNRTLNTTIVSNGNFSGTTYANAIQPHPYTAIVALDESRQIRIRSNDVAPSAAWIVVTGIII